MALNVGKLLSTLTTGTGMKVEKYLLNEGEKVVGTKTIQHLPDGCKLKSLGIDTVEIAKKREEDMGFARTIVLCKEGKPTKGFCNGLANDIDFDENLVDLYKDSLNKPWGHIDSLKDFIEALNWTKKSGF